MITKIEKSSSSIAASTPIKSIQKFSNNIITTPQLNVLWGGGIVEEDALGI